MSENGNLSNEEIEKKKAEKAVNWASGVSGCRLIDKQQMRDETHEMGSSDNGKWQKRCLP